VSTEGGLRYIKRDSSDVDPPLLQLAADVVRQGQVVWDVGPTDTPTVGSSRRNQRGRSGR
jgi:hypothetical protein